MSRTFYDIFRQKLYQAEETSVPNGMWENISKEIPVYGAKKTRRVGWLWFGALLLLLGAGVVYWMSIPETGYPENRNNAPSLASSAIAINSEEAGQDALKAVEEADSKEIDTRKIEAKESDAEQADVRKADVKKADVKKAELSNLSKAENLLAAISSNEKTINQRQQPIMSEVENDLTDVDPVTTNGIANNHENNGIPVASEKTELPIISNVQERDVENSGIVSLLSRNNEGNFLSFARKSQIPKPNGNPECYSFGPTRRGLLTLDIYGGPGYALRPFQSKGDDASSYIEARKQSETYQYSFQAGARLGLQLRNGLNAAIGLHYAQVGERFDLTKPGDTKEITISTIVTDPMGNPIDTIIETSIVTGTTVKEIYNRYHTLDVPVLIGYDVQLKGMTVGLNLGPVFNISSWQRGQFLDPTLNPKHIDLDNPIEHFPAYKTTLGIGGYLGVNVAFPVNEYALFFVEPHVLHRFQSVTIDTYPLDQQSTQAGLNVGVRFKL